MTADRAGRPGRASRPRSAGRGRAGRPGHPHRRVQRRPRRLHRPGGRRGRRPSPCTASPSGPDTRSCSARSATTPVLGAPGYPVSAALTFDIFAAPLLAELEGAAPRQRPLDHGPAGPQAAVRARHGRLGPGPARPGRRRARRHPAAARRRRADLARPRRRAARRARPGPRATTPASEVEVELLRGPGRDRPDHRRDRLARPGARPRRLRAARRRPADHAGVVQRRLARRAGRAAGRAVPPRRLAPARPGDRRVHAAVPGPAVRPRRGRSPSSGSSTASRA